MFKIIGGNFELLKILVTLKIGFLEYVFFTASIGGCGGQKYRHGGFPQQPQFS